MPKKQSPPTIQETEEIKEQPLSENEKSDSEEIDEESNEDLDEDI